MLDRNTTDQNLGSLGASDLKIQAYSFSGDLVLSSRDPFRRQDADRRGLLYHHLPLTRISSIGDMASRMQGSACLFRPQGAGRLETCSCKRLLVFLSSHRSEIMGTARLTSKCISFGFQTKRPINSRKEFSPVLGVI